MADRNLFDIHESEETEDPQNRYSQESKSPKSLAKETAAALFADSVGGDELLSESAIQATNNFEEGKINSTLDDTSYVDDFLERDETPPLEVEEEEEVTLDPDLMDDEDFVLMNAPELDLPPEEEKDGKIILNPDFQPMREYLAVPGHVAAIFSLHKNRLEADKKNAEFKILNAVDFDEHLEMLRNSYSDLSTAIQSAKAETGSDLAIGNSYVVTLEFVDDIIRGGDIVQTLKGLLISPKGTRSTLTVDAKHFSKNSAWRNTKVLGYIKDIKLLRAISSGSDRIQKFADCGYDSGVPSMGIDPRAVDYVAFSSHFHVLIDIINGNNYPPATVVKQEKPKEEINMEMIKNIVSDNVSAVKAAAKEFDRSLREDAKETLSDLAGVDYEIKEDDVFALAPQENLDEVYVLGGGLKDLDGEEVLELTKFKYSEVAEMMVQGLQDTGDALAYLRPSNWPEDTAEPVKIRIPRSASTISFEAGFDESLTQEEVVAIFKKHYLDPLFLKICPAALLQKIMDCLLPANCREAIKYLGVWRTRDMLEQIFALGRVIDTEDLKTAFDQWDELVETQFNFKAAKFNSNKAAFGNASLQKQKVYSESEDISVSFHLSTDNKEFENNKGKTCYILDLQNTFSVIKTDAENLRFRFTSETGEEIEYTTEPLKLAGNFNVFNGRYNHIGFTYTADAGIAYFYINGQRVELDKAKGNFFKGPLGMQDSASFTVGGKATTSLSNVQKGFHGSVDEVAIWNKSFDDEQWKKLGKITSDKNYKNMGLSKPEAWWRMGDSVGDTSKQIKDLGNEQHLTSYGENPSDSIEIIVARVARAKDEDKFIDILDRNLQLNRVCEAIIDLITGNSDSNFDLTNLKKRSIPKLPKFSQNPHLEVKLQLQKSVVTNLLKATAKFLHQITDKYLMQCQNWRPLAKAIAKGTFNGSGTPFEDMMAESPLIGLLTPQGQEQFLNQDFSILTRAALDFAKEPVKLSGKGVSEATLGIGNLSVSSNKTQRQGDGLFETIANMGPDGGLLGTDTNIAVSADGQIEVLRNTTQQMSTEEFVEALGGNMSQQTLNSLDSYIQQNYPDYADSFTNELLTGYYSNLGQDMGVSEGVNTLSYLAQELNKSWDTTDDPCKSQEDFRDRIGDPLTPGDIAGIKDFLGDTQDSIDDAGKDKTCELSIPLSAQERNSLGRTINDVYTPVLMAYDNDLTLFKMGSLTFGQEKKKVKKVLLKDSEFEQQVFEDGEMKSKKVKVEKTQINPEFESLLEQGYIPLKKDGSEDGTQFGGVMKKDWSIGALFSGEWGKEKGPYSLAPKVDGDDVKDPEGKPEDIVNSLGPYTDYDNPYATVYIPKADPGGNNVRAFSQDNLEFMNFGSADDLDSNSKPGYYLQRSVNSGRGIKNIVSKEKTGLLEPLKASSSPIVAGVTDRDLLTSIKHFLPFSRALNGKLITELETKRNDRFSPGTKIQTSSDFSMDPILQQKIIEQGYVESLDVGCDDPASENNGTQNDDTLQNLYTPQENVFEFIAQKNNSNLPSPSDLKVDVYDKIYREVLRAIFLKLSDSPLLKPIPGTEEGDGPTLYGMNFLNINQNPRLIDMASFTEQVAGDYTSLIACPQNLTEPPLITALKTSAPRILARSCLVDIMLKGIIPFSTLFFKRDDKIVQELILTKLENDMEVFSSDSAQVRVRIIEQYNVLANSGIIDRDPIETEGTDWFYSGWKDAMRYFLEDEFNFIASKMHHLVSGDCLPESDAALRNAMTMIIIDYIKKAEGKLQIESSAILTDGDTIPLNEVDFKEQAENLDKFVYEIVFEEKSRISLAKFQISAEEAFETLGIDPSRIGEIECETGHLYPDSGTTTETEGHSHKYEIDAEGRGRTTEIVGDDVPFHTHAINEYAVIPLFDFDGNRQHSHALPQLDTSVTTNRAVLEKLTTFMDQKLVESDDTRILFEFCFSVPDISNLALIYSLMSNENQIINSAFRSTKRAIFKMFDIIWRTGADTSADPCNTAPQNIGLDLNQMFPDFGDAILDPAILLAMVLAPLQTYRGWTKTTDPNVFITTTISDILNLPIIPIMKKKNIPDPFDDFKIKCVEVPTFPGKRPMDEMFLATYGVLSQPLVEGGIATVTTWAPTLFGLPPLSPLPFGYIYYFGVGPLIFILKDLPRLMKLMGEDSDSQQLLASIGMNVSPNIGADCKVIDVDSESQAGDDAEEEEDCPPVPDFQQTTIESRGDQDC